MNKLLRMDNYNVIKLILISFLTIYSYDLEKITVSFEAAMNHSESRFYDQFIRNLSMQSDSQWNLWRNLYNEYLKQPIDAKVRIPKILHLIWLGSPFPERCQELLDIWKMHHSNWQIMIWDDIAAKQFPMENRRVFDAVNNYGAKSDILRYEILNKIGGLYVDTDFLCLKSMDIFHHTCDFYAGLLPVYDECGVLANAIIACSPGHPIIKKCITKINFCKNTFSSCEELMAATGPVYFSKIFKETVFENKSDDLGVVVALPCNFFYPMHADYRFTYKTLENAKTFAAPESMCIHLWACSWQK